MFSLHLISVYNKSCCSFCYWQPTWAPRAPIGPSLPGWPCEQQNFNEISELDISFQWKWSRKSFLVRKMKFSCYFAITCTSFWKFVTNVRKRSELKGSTKVNFQDITLEASYGVRQRATDGRESEFKCFNSTFAPCFPGFPGVPSAPGRPWNDEKSNKFVLKHFNLSKEKLAQVYIYFPRQEDQSTEERACTTVRRISNPSLSQEWAILPKVLKSDAAQWKEILVTCVLIA